MNPPSTWGRPLPIVLSILAGTGCSDAVAPAPPGGGEPAGKGSLVAVLPSDRADLRGSEDEGYTKSVEFTLRNRGAVTVRLLESKATCGCLKPVLANDILRPGDETTLKAQVTGDKFSDREVRIIVQTDRPEQREVVMTVVVKAANEPPAFLGGTGESRYAGTYSTGDTQGTLHVRTIEATGSAGWLTEASLVEGTVTRPCSVEQLAGEAKERGNTTRRVYCVTFPLDGRPRSAQGRLHLLARTGELAADFPILYEIQSPIVVTPTRVAAHVSGEKRSFTRTILINAQGLKSPPRLHVEKPLPTWLTGDVASTGADPNVHKLVVHCDLAGLEKGVHQATLKLSTGFEPQPTIEIPIEVTSQ